MIYFSADIHFSHNNIIKYCKRPFSDAETMNEAIINRWNCRVGQSDTAYHLGDFVCYGSERGVEGLRIKASDLEVRLNGKIIHILGNHDSNNSVKKSIHEAYIRLGGHNIMLVHQPPFYVREGVDLVLCGHVHNSWEISEATNNKGKDIPIVNVGTDVWNYKPITINEINKRLAIHLKNKGNQ